MATTATTATETLRSAEALRALLLKWQLGYATTTEVDALVAAGVLPDYRKHAAAAAGL